MEALSLQESPELPAEPVTEPVALPAPPAGYTGVQVYIGKEPHFKGGSSLTDEQYDQLHKLSLTDERIRIVAPRLSWREEKAGCRVERDAVTGKYSVLCPEENIAMLNEGWTGAQQVTFINNDTTQAADRQDVKENDPVLAAGSGVTIYKDT